MGFLEKCRAKAEYKIYHIPLDVHVSSVLRNAFIGGRYTLGHLHYFTADSAIATLKDTGHEIVDYLYTNAALGFSNNTRQSRGRSRTVHDGCFLRSVCRSPQEYSVDTRCWCWQSENL